MKGIAIFGLIFSCLVFGAFCLPITPNEVEDIDQTYHGIIRVKRFTCDVLSVEAAGVALNDAACAGHCLWLGKAGGWCDDRRVCNCRKW